MRSLILLCAFVAACDYGFEKQSHVSKLRVLAVQAEPAEIAVAPGETPPVVRLTALAVEPSGAQVQVSFAICDVIGLPDPSLDCPGTRGFPLESADPLTARMDAAPVVRELEPRMPEGISHVPLVIGFDATAGAQRLHGFATLNLRTSDGRPANLNPALAAVTADGVPLAADGSTPVRADSKVRLSPVAAEGAAEQTDTGPERLVFSFYATDGEIDSLRSTNVTADGIEVDPDVDWTAPKTPGPVQLWIVVRDGRGGVGWLARTVQVVP